MGLTLWSKTPVVTPCETRTRCGVATLTPFAVSAVAGDWPAAGFCGAAGSTSFVSDTVLENAKSKGIFVVTAIGLPFLMKGLNFHFFLASTAAPARTAAPLLRS